MTHIKHYSVAGWTAVAPSVLVVIEEQREENEGEQKKKFGVWVEGISHVRTSCCYWVAGAVWRPARPIVAHLAVKQP